MKSGWLWLLSDDGIAYRISTSCKLDSPIDALWKSEPCRDCPLKDLASCSNKCFGLDSDGIIRLFLLPSPISVRRKIEIIEHQRWYPVIGWKRPLPGEPSITSVNENSDGNIGLRSSGWRWEDNWIVRADNSRDKDGWQYAQSFGVSKWKKSSDLLAMVRKRSRFRHQKYVAIGEWTPIPSSDLSFTAITCGCQSIFSDGGILYALSVEGDIYWRKFTDQNPEGDEFNLIDPVFNQKSNQNIIFLCGEREDLVFISASSSDGILLTGSWDGSVYYRTAISKECPGGLQWAKLSTPNNQPIISASICSLSLWLQSADGHIWTSQIPNNEILSSLAKASLTSYTCVGHGMISPSVSKNGNMLCIRSSDRKIFCRTGISINEPAGKEYFPLVERADNEILSWKFVEAGDWNGDIPMHWKTSDFLSSSISSFLDKPWRKSILNNLTETNKLNWDLFNERTDSEFEGMGNGRDRSSSLMRNIRVNIRSTQSPRYMDGLMQIDGNSFLLKMQRITVSINSDEVFRVDKTFDSFPFRFCLELDTKIDVYRIAFSTELDRDAWFDHLHSFVIRSISTQQPSGKAFWTVAPSGFVRYHIGFFDVIKEEKEKKQNSDKIHFRVVNIPGHFHQISTGIERIVWALTFNSTPYALPSEWNPTQTDYSTFSNTAEDIKEFTVWEYQRWQIFRGFVTFEGRKSEIYAWMDENGPVAQKYSRLPSKEWSWTNEWELMNSENDEGWEYSINSTGPFTEERQRSHFRRRQWKRTARFCSKSPWIAVDSPALSQIEVQQQIDDRILVWAVTLTGHLLVRQGISQERPQGTVWKEVTSNEPLRAISIASPTEIWAISTTGRIFFRKCSDQIDMECIDWNELNIPRQTGNITHFVVKSNNLWLIQDNILTLINIQTKAIHTICNVFGCEKLMVNKNGSLLIAYNNMIIECGQFTLQLMKKGRSVKKEYHCDARTEYKTGSLLSASIDC